MWNVNHKYDAYVNRGGKYSTGEVSSSHSLYNTSSKCRYAVNGLGFKPRMVFLYRQVNGAYYYCVLLTNQDYSPYFALFGNTANANQYQRPYNYGNAGEYWTPDYFVTDDGFSVSNMYLGSDYMNYYCC